MKDGSKRTLMGSGSSSLADGFVLRGKIVEVAGKRLLCIFSMERTNLGFQTLILGIEVLCLLFRLMHDGGDLVQLLLPNG